MKRPLPESRPHDPWSVVYAAQGSDGFNARLHGVLRDLTRDILAAVGDPLMAVMLAGAYGDGRGRCIPVNGGPGSGIWSHGQAPAEDIEIMVVANAKQKIVRRLLRPVGQKYASILKVDIRFTHVLDESRLNQVRPSLEWYELVQSHQLLFGSEAVFARFRDCFGLVDDGCAQPRFLPGEALWLHCQSAFLAFQYFRFPGNASSRHFFTLVRHLGDALLLQNDIWDAVPELRDSMILRLLSDDDWCRSQSPVALSVHELYRESICFLMDESTEDLRVDWPSYFQAWLFVNEYLAFHAAGRARIQPGLALWRNYLRESILKVQSDPSHKPPSLINGLFRRIGDWYYQIQ
jgi:hypothetical protein